MNRLFKKVLQFFVKFYFVKKEKKDLMAEGSINNSPDRKSPENHGEATPETGVLLQRVIELSGMKSRLISVMSHDLRTPLTGIFTSAEIMGLNPRVSGEQSLLKYIRRIMQSVKSLDMIIKNVSTVDKSTRGGITRHDHKIILSDLVDEITGDTLVGLPDEMAFRSILLTTEKKVTGDKALIIDVLGNLIDNAIRFSGETGEVELRIEKEGGYLKFTVADNGQGIAGENTEELFQLFGKGRYSRHAPGAGLGLFVARHIAEVLGGEIRLTSNEPVGCLAIFTVPVE